MSKLPNHKSFFAAGKISLKNLFTKPATVDFPDNQVALPPDFRGVPEVNSDNCILCMRCLHVCPTDAIAIHDIEDSYDESDPSMVIFDEIPDEHILQVNLGKCCYCGECEDVCKFDAIELKDQWLLSSMDKDALTRTYHVFKPRKKKKK